MILFVQKLPSGRIRIVSTEGQQETDLSFSALFGRWALQGLSTWEGRVRAVRRRFGWKAKIPIFCGEELILMPIRSMRSEKGLFVNFAAVRSWKTTATGTAEVTFWNGTILLAGASAPFRRRMEEARLVRDVAMGKIAWQENAYMPKKPDE
jgi:hypothetical protein